MAMMDGNDPNVRSDWWSENANAIPSGSYNKVATAPDGVPVYQNGSQYFTRNADGSFTQQFQGGLPDWLSKPAQPASGGGGNDVRAFIASLAAMPGADPSLANDPDYWERAINSRGGLTDANRQYWQDAAVGPTAFFNNPNREQSAAPLGQIGAAPGITPYTPPAAPAYTPYDPGQAPTPTRFVAPTAEEARNTPGYQFALEQGNQGLQRSAAAKGGLLSGGALKDISAYNVGMADQNYQNVWGNAFNANEAGNTDALNAYLGNANAHIGASGLNLQGTNSQFQNTYLPSWNAYQSNVGQGQFNANYGLQANQQALGAQNQYWNQGFAENQNAYNQYDNSQKTAFDQWYKLMQAGNPGNPYA
jgi:hypothetical protein